MKIAKRDLKKLINEELNMLLEVDSYSLANYVMALLGGFTRTGGLRKNIASLVIGTVYHIDIDLARALEDDINKNPRFLDSSAPRTVTENSMAITKMGLSRIIKEEIEAMYTDRGRPDPACPEFWEGEEISPDKWVPPIKDANGDCDCPPGASMVVLTDRGRPMKWCECHHGHVRKITFHGHMPAEYQCVKDG